MTPLVPMSTTRAAASQATSCAAPLTRPRAEGSVPVPVAARLGVGGAPRRPSPSTAGSSPGSSAPASAAAASSSAWAPWNPVLEDPTAVGGQPGAATDLQGPDLACR